MRRRIWLVAILLISLCRGDAVYCGESARRDDGDPSADAPAPIDSGDSDLLDLDVEQLSRTDVVVPSFDVEVTSVGRQESTVGKSPAAVFVITQEMIRRSGVTTVADALRMAPGVQVAKINANQWAVSARGFNSRFANKLLVMVDGRSVYTPLFSGVYWDAQDLLLEDIERIEVIRGPGGTVWGANAVNGVISITTKSAEKTQGLMVLGGMGSEDRAIAGFRYGGSNGAGLDYRVYGKYFDRDSGFVPGGSFDDWRQKRIGFRADWKDGCDYDAFTLQGDYYEGKSGVTSDIPQVAPPFGSQRRSGDNIISGGNILGRWTRTFDDDTNFALQFYYDRSDRLGSSLDQRFDVLDVDFTHHFTLADSHHIVWGANYRHVSDQLGFPEPFFALDPDHRRTNLEGVFVQDQFALSDAVDVTLGSKFEHNDFTGFEYQPSARALWKIDPKHVAWASASRAVRTPSRVNDDLRLQFGVSSAPPTFIRSFGSRQTESEILWAYEVGFRSQPRDDFAWDVAAFYNDYEKLLIEIAAPVIPPPPALIIPTVTANGMTGEAYGVEFSGSYVVNPCWRLAGSYSFLQLQMHAAAAADNDSALEVEQTSPHNQVNLQSSWDLYCGWEFDLIGRYVDTIPQFGIDSYTSIDLRLGYRPNDCWEFSIVGQNLLDSDRVEYESNFLSSGVERGVYGQVIWRR
jgi:iron complex outermembrane receptor protein